MKRGIIMKSKVRRILAIMLTLVMLASCVAAFPLNAQAFDNDVKSGVVAIVFYLAIPSFRAARASLSARKRKTRSIS